MVNKTSADSHESPAKRRRTRGDRRSRLRRRDEGAYDHTRHLCRAILELTCLDDEDDKENVSPSCQETGAKFGRTKIFFKEKQVS